MTHKPLISILIATYNCAASLEVLLDNLSKQRPERNKGNWELLVADGGSSDGSAELIGQRQGSLISWSKSAPDGGIYDALNSAVKAATGEWVLVLGADDLLPATDTLAAISRELRNIPVEVLICYGSIEIEHNGQVFRKEYPDYKVFSKMFGNCPPIHHQSALVRRRAILDAGGFDTRFRIHADYDLLSRLPKTAPPVRIGCVVARFSDSGMSGNSNNVICSLKEFWTIRRRLGLNPVEKQWGKRYSIQLVKVVLQSLLPRQTYDWILSMHRGR